MPQSYECLRKTVAARLRKSLDANYRTADLRPADLPADVDDLGRLANIGSHITKHVSVLQIDIAGSTQMVSKLTLDQLGTILNLFFPTVAQITYDRGGAVDKYPGDAVMSFFGLKPGTASGRRTNSVVAACLAMAAIEDVINPVLDNYGIPIISCKAGVSASSCRIAHVGTTRHHELVALGLAPHYAASLEKAADSGEVLVETNTLKECNAKIRQFATTEYTTKDTQIDCWSIDWRGAADAY